VAGRSGLQALQVAVIGGSEPSPGEAAAAEEVGKALARAGATVVCGGLGGVMEAACRGAKAEGGLTVGILPGSDASAANAWVDVAVPTGLGEARNVVVVNSGASVVAIGGEYGTLSEIALALRAGKPVIGVVTWELTRPGGAADSGIVAVGDPVDAADLAVRLGAALLR
jgi:uncharacterized protein (TIGR00725 family)